MTTAGLPTVHVGIVTYNSLADLPQCLTGLQRQTHRPIHVTVFDNDSTDESVPWLRRALPEARLLVNGSNVGYGLAHNMILDSSGLQPGEFYMTLNPDVVLDAGYLEELVKCLRAHGGGWGTGKLLQPGDGLKHRLRGGHLRLPERCVDDRPLQRAVLPVENCGLVFEIKKDGARVRGLGVIEIGVIVSRSPIETETKGQRGVDGEGHVRGGQRSPIGPKKAWANGDGRGQ